jgi:hypothetical protein
MLERWIVAILGARALGHGRALESFLAFVCFVYAMDVLFWPNAAFQSQATADIAWKGYGYVISIPFLLKAGFTGWGVYANRHSLPGSRQCRIIGGTIGTFLWTFFLVKFYAVDAIGALGTALCIGGIVASIRIVGLAMADLPRPGAPSQI